MSTKLHILVYKFEAPGRVGVPDLILLHRGRCLFIEVKSPKGTGRVTPRQALEHERIQAQGFEVHVVDSKAQGARVINNFLSEITL